MDDHSRMGEDAAKLLRLSRMRMDGYVRKMSDLAKLADSYLDDRDFRLLVNGIAEGLGFDVLGARREHGLILMSREKSPFCSNLDVRPKGFGHDEDTAKRHRRRIFFLAVFITSLFCIENGDVDVGRKISDDMIVNGLKERIAALAAQDGNHVADGIARSFMDDNGEMLPTGKIGKDDDSMEFRQSCDSKTYSGLVRTALKKMEASGYLVHSDIDDAWMPTEIFKDVGPYIWEKIGQHLLVAGENAEDGNGI